MMTTPTIDVRPLDAPLGAEIVGIDVSVRPDNARVDDLKKALAEFGVLVFRDQNLEHERDQVAFSDAFGDSVVPWLHGGEQNTYRKIREISPRPAYTGEHPSCVYWVNGPDFYDRPNDGYAQDWHADLSYLQNPLWYSFLYAVEAPESGYQTWFNSQYAAFDSLDETARTKLEGCSISHEFKSAFPNLSGALHPVVRRHPRSGRNALFGIPGYIHGRPVGLPEEEWTQILSGIEARIEAERFLYKHEWRTGDLLVWDNRCVLHRRGPQLRGQTRILRRSVAGDGTAEDLRMRLLGWD